MTDLIDGRPVVIQGLARGRWLISYQDNLLPRSEVLTQKKLDERSRARRSSSNLGGYRPGAGRKPVEAGAINVPVHLYPTQQRMLGDWQSHFGVSRAEAVRNMIAFAHAHMPLALAAAKTEDPAA